MRRRIEELGLEPHPEGGYYRETHRSEVVLAQKALPEGYPADRSAVTSILFLLPTGTESKWHRVRGEEIWFHQEGDVLELEMRNDGETAFATEWLGPDGALQAVVPPGWWQCARALPGELGYVLVGCVVAPGFEFDDFELRS